MPSPPKSFIAVDGARTVWFIQRVLLTVAGWITLREIDLPTEDRPDGVLGILWNPALMGDAENGLAGLYPVVVSGLLIAFFLGWWPGVTSAALTVIVIARMNAEIATPAALPLLLGFCLQAAVSLYRVVTSLRHSRLFTHSERQIYASRLAAATLVGCLAGGVYEGIVTPGFDLGTVLVASAGMVGLLGKFISFPDARLPRLFPGRKLKVAGAGVSRVLSYLPLKLALLLVIAATVVGEHFPLSTFPMYSKWKPDTYLIYFTDKTGEPIAIQKLTHLKAGRYKGIFDSQLRVIKEANRTAERKPDLIADFGPEEYGIAGSYVLRWIDKNVNPGLVAGLEPLKPLKVWRREIIIIDGKLTHHDLEVASGQGPEPTPEVK